MARATYTDDMKARVLAGLATGASVAELAREYGVKPATIRQWKTRTPVTVVTPVSRKDEPDIGRLLGTYISETLTTLAVQSREFRDAAWLKAQPAGELANLHGALADRAFRLLAALVPDPDGGPEQVELPDAIEGAARALPD